MCLARCGGYSGATVALGGTSGTGAEEGLRVGDFDVVGVSYDMPSVGLGKIPGTIGGLAKMGSFFSSGLPETSTDVRPGQPGYNPGGTANFFDRNNPNASVTVTAEDFNNMKNTDFKGALAESYKSAVRAVSAVRAGDIEAYNNLSTDRLGPSGKSAKDLADAATVKGLMDKVDISNPQGIMDNLKNALGGGTFAEAVDKLNDAERSVLEGMGVDLDDSLDISPAEQAALDKQTRESMAAAVAAANKAKAEKARAEQQRAEAEKAAAFEATKARAEARERGGDGGGGGPASKSGGYSGGKGGSGPGASPSGSKEGGPGSFAEGGLVKQMKQSGIASKK